MARANSLVHLVAPDGQEAHPRPSTLRALLLMAVALTAFALTCQLLRNNLPRLPGLTPTHKFEFFEKHRDEYDTLFIGPSSVYRHVDPQVFDRILIEHGVQSRSFNFGINAITSLETLYTLEEILELQPTGLKKVFIELRGQGLEVLGRNARTQRFLSWHDTAITWRAVKLLAESEEHLSWKLQNLQKHLRAFSYWFTNIGQLRRIVADHLSGTAISRSQLQAANRGRLLVEIGEANNGFVSLNEAERTDSERADGLAERHTRWLETRDAVFDQLGGDWKQERPLRNVSGAPRLEQKLTPNESALVSAIVSLVERHGCQVIFFDSPNLLRGENLLYAANREGLLPTFLNMDDKERYSPLFNEGNWFDSTHLNGRGARLYSNALANRFVEHLETIGNVH